jgi:hypothetical protein
MALQQQQDLLARLYTDNEFRSEFLRKPSSFAEVLGVSPEEADCLAAVAGGEVEWFSESLVSKRLREVRKMLPMSEQELGAKEFARNFREFSERFAPTSVKKHLEDSLAFAMTLIKDPSLEGSERSVVRFESGRLRHNAFEKRFSLCLLRFDPRRSTGYTTYDKHRGVGVWIAIGGWSRIFFRRSWRRVSS